LYLGRALSSVEEHYGKVDAGKKRLKKP